MLRMTLLIALLVPALVQTQTRPANIPPLPQVERFVPRGGLAVTLRITPDQVQVDQAPTFTVVVRNVGTSRVLLPAVPSNIRIYDRDGRFVPARRSAIVDYVGTTVRTSELVVLEPGGTHEFPARAEYHDPNDFGGVGLYSLTSAGASTDTTVVGLGLPPGTYSVRFGYYGLQGYGVGAYEQPLPPALWEGAIETAPVRLTVLPLAGSHLAQVVADIDGPGRASDLVELSSLARAPETIDAWIRRFERNADERAAVVAAIHAVGDSGGIARLLDLVAALPERERQRTITESGPLLGRDAPGCAGVPWLLAAARTHSSNIPGLTEAFQAVGRRCPALIGELRDVVQSPIQVREDGGEEAYYRANLVELLGRLGDRRDVPLLIAIARGELPAVRPSQRDTATLRSGALRGLASLGGEEAAQVLLDQLRFAGSDRFSSFESVTIAGRLPLPAATPLLIDLLGAPGAPVAMAAARALQSRGDRAAIPALEARLTSSDRYVRESVAGALRTAGDAVSLPLMRTLVSDGDPGVQMTALFHLAQRGDRSDLPVFIEHLASPRSYEPALQGIDRLGTSEAFPLLRSRLDAVPRGSRTFVMMALRRLTFATIWRDPSEWDTWWASHSSSTRADWAREALTNAGNLAPLALEYLSRTGGLPAALLDASLVSRDVHVRLAAARIVGESDWRRAVLLMARELENRSAYSCRQAVGEFNRLMALNESVDCTDFTARASAGARWSAMTSSLPVTR